MTDEEPEMVNRLISVSDWDAPLPVGDWTGPQPVPLFMPRFGESADIEENMKALQITHIRTPATKDQAAQIKDWVEKNVPSQYSWLVQNLEIYHPTLPVTFFATHSSEVSADDTAFTSQHPEILTDSWDKELDTCRLQFIEFLKSLGCSISLMTSIEALDGGVLIKKGYERPAAMRLPDMFAQFPGKKLWHYFTLSKFMRFLQTSEVWFSRPQFFDDPHEFSSDEASQRSLIEWRLNSFADEYNRAVRTNREKYLATVSDLAAPLDKSEDGLIVQQERKLSEFPEALLSSLRADLKSWQESYFISCWRLSDVDSVAIWNQYADLSEGVAISVPHDALQRALKANGDVRFSVVNYVDLSSSSDPQHMPPFMYKDVRYSAEEEARFYFQARTTDDGLRGIGLKIDVQSLVDRIYVAPNAAQWFKDVVTNLVQQYGLDAEIVDSPLGQIPQKF